MAARIDCLATMLFFFDAFFPSALLSPPFLSFSPTWRDEIDALELCVGSNEPETENKDMKNER